MRSLLITGYPQLLPRRLLAQLLLDAPPGSQIWLLCPPKRLAAAQKALAGLPRRRGFRVELLAGDVLDLHLGLRGAAFRALSEQVTELFHLDEVTELGASEALMRRVNVEGTRGVLEVARELPRLERLHYLSTAFVSGDRDGIIAEDELDLGQRASDLYAASKLEAERLILRARDRLPVTRYRPSHVVGDSATGEVDRLEGPLYQALRLATSALKILPVPSGADHPLHVVPVDHVARVISALSVEPRAIGRAFHVVDPNPWSVRRAYERIAELCHKRVQLVPVPRGATEAVRRLPWVEALLRPQRRGFLGPLAFYTQGVSAELMPPSIRCPQLAEYLPRLLESTKRGIEQGRDATLVDTLDGSDGRV